MPSLSGALRTVASAVRVVSHVLGNRHADPRVDSLIADAEDARRRGRSADALALYQRALAQGRSHGGALRGLRDLSLALGRWEEAVELGRRALLRAASAERPQDAEALAIASYELGRSHLEAGRSRDAVAAFRSALRARHQFVPATVALGDAYLAVGESREAIRVWERATELEPSLPVLLRLEEAYRREGSPRRMIARYREAARRAPEDLAIAIALGRVYLELEMLDDAADEFEQLEARAPESPAVHAFLGAIFERRGQLRDACAEYRHGLRDLLRSGSLHRCSACHETSPTWHDRCPACGRWNTLRA